LLWLWYMWLVLAGLYAICRDRLRLQTNGVIQLSAVSTQAIALVAVDLSYEPGLQWIDYWTAHQVFQQIARFLNITGAAFYVFCLVLIVQRYWRQQDWTLVDDWANTNCILHGGMSITGLTAALIGIVPVRVCLGIWLYSFLMFLLVEAVEILRAVLRIRRLGWREGVFTYHVSQWARNFTFGMFYAFTWVIVSHFYAFLPPALAGLLHWILAYGSYLVMALLIAEMVLYLRAHLKPRPRVGMPVSR